MIVENRSVRPLLPADLTFRSGDTVLVSSHRVLAVQRGDMPLHGFLVFLRDERQEFLAYQFLRLLVEVAAIGFVDEGQRPVGTEAVDKLGLVLDDGAVAVLRGPQRLLGSLALGDVDPQADDLDRLSLVVTDQSQLVTHPDVCAVLPPEAVFVGVQTARKQVRQLAKDPLHIVRMDVVSPEPGAFGEVLRCVADDVGYVVANERGAVVTRGPGRVDDRRGGGEQVLQPLICNERVPLRLLPFGDVAAGDVHDVAPSDLHDGGAQFNVEQRAVAAPIPSLCVHVALLLEGFGDRAHQGDVLFGHEVPGVERTHLLVGVPVELAGVLVGVEDIAVEILEEDRVGGALEQAAVLLLGLHKAFMEPPQDLLVLAPVGDQDGEV